MLIIGIHGRARAGKDSIAKIIAPRHVLPGGEVIRVSDGALVADAVQIALADPLKLICRAVYDFSNAQLWGDARDAPDRRYPLEEKWDPHWDGTGSYWRCRYCFEAGDATLIPMPYAAAAPPDIGHRHYLTPRGALQRLGTEWGRATWPDTWIRLLLQHAEGLAAPLTVVSDVRFDNEAAMIRARGGQVWKVVRSTAAPVTQHASEAGISEHLIDKVIPNHDDLGALRGRVAEAIR